MDRLCSMQGRGEKGILHFRQNAETHLEDVGIDEGTILKRILQNYGGRYGIN
jgi:hypothetical protein